MKAKLFQIFFAFLAAHTAISLQAGTTYWTNTAGGSVQAASNWSPNTVPGPSDIGVFTNRSGYALSLDSDTVIGSLSFIFGIVTQSWSGKTLQVPNDYRVGAEVGATSKVSIISGFLSITNDMGTGLFSLGEAATGQFSIRGGNVIANRIQAKTTNALLSLDYGELTTTAGAEIDFPTELLLGTVQNQTMTWNIVGGTNEVWNGGRFGYGGITLGGDAFTGRGRAILNIQGPNTRLNTFSLDTYGNNILTITDGAKYTTRSVQLGLSSGVNNLVVISGAGSSWINEYLMYFGMHSGAQTMLITNGGYFQTGGPFYSDMDFTSLQYGDIKIIVSGTNSAFYSYGGMDLGAIWSSSPSATVTNILRIENGGKLWANELNYGSLLIANGNSSTRGNRIEVENANAWIGKMRFDVGALSVRNGTAQIDNLSINGGEKAVLELSRDLLIGYDGQLSPGDLRVGADWSHSTGHIFRGDLRLGGWQIGALENNVGSATLADGRVILTNYLNIGLLGAGSLTISNGSVQTPITRVHLAGAGSGHLELTGPRAILRTHQLHIGGEGSVNVRGGATLQADEIIAGFQKVSIESGALEFATNAPWVLDQSVRMTNGVISFRDTLGAPINLTDASYLGRVVRDGPTALQFINSTNASIQNPSNFGAPSPNYSRLIFNGGTNRYATVGFAIEQNSSLAATNSFVTMDGLGYLSGAVTLSNSTIRFTGPIVIRSTATFSGKGTLYFDGSVALPSTDVVIPDGLVVGGGPIVSDGSRLIVQGGFIPTAGDTNDLSAVRLENGWVTYVDTNAAPLSRPIGIATSADFGLQLIRSTNAPISLATFQSGADFSKLRLSAGSAWESEKLVVGAGGLLSYFDASAKLRLGVGGLVIEDGGAVIDDGGGNISYFGFAPTVSNLTATIRGTNSYWQTANLFAVGTNGARNTLILENGGKLFSDRGGISGFSNTVIVSGPGSGWAATNGIGIQGGGSLIVREGASLVSTQVSMAGGRFAVTGASAVLQSLRVSSSFPRIEFRDGAQVVTTNVVLAPLSVIPTSVEISGPGTTWSVPSSIVIANTSFGSTNLVVVRDAAILSSPSITVSNSGFSPGPKLSIYGGHVFATNSAGTGLLTNSGILELDGGSFVADRFVVNGSRANIIINEGRAAWRSLDSSVALKIGDARQRVTLELLGGTNKVPAGLEIRAFSKLTGRGTIEGPLTVLGAIEPSDLKVKGAFHLETNSELRIVLGQSALSASSTVQVRGALSVGLPPGAGPSASDIFPALSASSISGEFANASIGQRILTRDRLGSFQVIAIAGGIALTDYRSEDLDSDRVSDSWEIDNFGPAGLATGTGPNDLDGDKDGDGISNREEFRLKLDPNDDGSSLQLSFERLAAQIIAIRFSAASDAQYRIELSNDLATWTEVPFENVIYDSAGGATWYVVTDGEAGFFRVVAE